MTTDLRRSPTCCRIKIRIANKRKGTRGVGSINWMSLRSKPSAVLRVLGVSLCPAAALEKRAGSSRQPTSQAWVEKIVAPQEEWILLKGASCIWYTVWSSSTTWHSRGHSWSNDTLQKVETKWKECRGTSRKVKVLQTQPNFQLRFNVYGNFWTVSVYQATWIFLSPTLASFSSRDHHLSRPIFLWVVARAGKDFTTSQGPSSPAPLQLPDFMTANPKLHFQEWQMQTGRCVSASHLDTSYKQR